MPVMPAFPFVSHLSFSCRCRVVQLDLLHKSRLGGNAYPKTGRIEEQGISRRAACLHPCQVCNDRLAVPAGCAARSQLWRAVGPNLVRAWDQGRVGSGSDLTGPQVDRGRQRADVGHSTLLPRALRTSLPGPEYRPRPAHAGPTRRGYYRVSFIVLLFGRREPPFPGGGRRGGPIPRSPVSRERIFFAHCRRRTAVFWLSHLWRRQLGNGRCRRRTPSSGPELGRR